VRGNGVNRKREECVKRGGEEVSQLEEQFAR